MPDHEVLDEMRDNIRLFLAQLNGNETNTTAIIVQELLAYGNQEEFLTLKLSQIIDCMHNYHRNKEGVREWEKNHARESHQ